MGQIKGWKKVRDYKTMNLWRSRKSDAFVCARFTGDRYFVISGRGKYTGLESVMDAKTLIGISGSWVKAQKAAVRYMRRHPNG